MQIIAGTEAGQLKIVQYPDGLGPIPKILPFEPHAKQRLELAAAKMNQSCKTIFPVDKSKSILQMVTLTFGETSLVIMARKNGTLDLWDFGTNELIRTISVFNKETVYAGMHLLNDTTLLVANENGEIGIVSFMGDAPPEFLDLSCPVSSLRASPLHPHLVAYGGKETDLTLLDLNGPSESPSRTPEYSSTGTPWLGTCTLTVTWKAKNPTEDYLGLPIPVWITDIQFLNPNCSQLATCTAYHEVKLYDTRKSSFPIRVVEVGNHPFRSMCVAGPDTIAVANSAGTISLLSTKNLRTLGVLKGPSGAVYQILICPKHRILAAVGLDRTLRTYDVRSRQLTGKWFLKQQLRSIVFVL